MTGVDTGPDGDPLRDAQVPRLLVFSHPGHELTVFGLLQRLRPDVLFLTDGGGGARLAQTRQALASIGLLERARVLPHGDGAFYAALLAHDVGYLRRVADEVRAAVESARARQVLCDAVEFYNPVHDLALPLTLAAVADRAAVEVFELPVVYQRDEPGEVCTVHRFPDAAAPGQAALHLTEAELAAKLRARDEIYHELRAQFPDLLAVSAAHAAVEVVRRSNRTVPAPDASRVLRYERRGRLLLAQGMVEQAITHAQHYAPMTAALLP